MREEQKERALLLGVKLNDGEDFKKSMEELVALSEACGMEVVGTITQNMDRQPHASLYMGRGKLEMCIRDRLYGGYDKIPESSRIFIEATYQNLDLEELYKKIREDERQNKDILLEFQDHYPEVLNGDNLVDILKAAKARKNATLPPLDAYADHNV